MTVFYSVVPSDLCQLYSNIKTEIFFGRYALPTETRGFSEDGSIVTKKSQGGHIFLGMTLGNAKVTHSQ
jgi:hypothetical protein